MSCGRRVYLFLMCLVLTPATMQPWSKALFSPDSRPASYLITMINNARERVYAAVYLITDRNIASALVRAKNERDIDVQFVSDEECLDARGNQIDYLWNNDVELFLYFSSRYEGKMHNKFVLIDNKVWTGSFNWTWSANHRNQENIIITDDRSVVRQFERQFEILKERCVTELSSNAGKKKKRRGVKENVKYLVKRAKKRRVSPKESPKAM